MLEINPYYLLGFAPWKTVDPAAAKLGISADDPRRLVGAVESALYDRLQRGHTLTDRATLLRVIKRKLGERNASKAIQLALDELAITGTDDKGFQTAGAAALEIGIATRIKAMLSGEAPEQPSLLNTATGDWEQAVILDAERQQQSPFNDEQRQAIQMPFQHGISLLTGGAGVGKTSVLKVINRLATKRHLKVFQMALAGRAVKRMSDATNAPAMTIARFLMEARAERLEITSDSLVIVDEASMLDLPTAYRILRVLPDGARLILVGDPAQLPPIGFGLVFHRLVDSPVVPQTRLLRVYRQDGASGIPDVATEVREHRIPQFVPFNGVHSGVSFIECDQDKTMQILREIQDVWSEEEWQALTSLKVGRAGTHHLNGSFHADRCSGDPFADCLVPGEPVIHLVNDYDRGVMNGTLGTVVQIHEDQVTEIDFEGVRHLLQPEEVRDNVELAYVISVHKAQGSQFSRVVVVVGKSRLLDHALIYTALTRAIEQVVFVGDRRAFEHAVESAPLASQRSVGFAL